MISKLFAAVAARDEAAVMQALQQGVNVDELGRGSMSALMVAASLGEVSLIARLLEYGANPNLLDHNGLNALAHARLTGQTSAANLLTSITKNRSDKSHRLGFHSVPNVAQTDGFVPLLDTLSGSKLQEEGKEKTKKVLENTVQEEDLKKVLEFSEQPEAVAAVDKILAIASVNRLRASRKLPELKLNLHCLFVGNPGTGKTTFARLYANACKSLGIIKQGHLVEASRTDLVAEYQGQTAVKTTKLFEKAVGGVLFIDEAYSLSRGKEDGFGQEAIDTIVKLMEDYREEIVVILAGYSEEMSSFLRSNPGLESRIPNVVPFQDYDNKTLLQIVKKLAEEQGFRIEQDQLSKLEPILQKRRSSLHFGNAREARNLLEQAIATHSQRLKAELERAAKEGEELTQHRLVNLRIEDFQSFEAKVKSSSSFLSDFVGLKHVKAELQKISNLMKVSKLRGSSQNHSLHLVFTGNPGVGKSSVARGFAEELLQLGYLAKGHLVEVSASDLVAGYQGQTSIKTKEKLQDALGGVFFLDEAYSLLGASDSYGSQALQTILKFMEDHRSKFVVILAGYKQQMDHLLKSNSGLESRFTHHIHFPDYNSQELLRIMIKEASRLGFTLEESCFEILERQIDYALRTEKPFSNGRWVRNFMQVAVGNHANRLAAYAAPQDLGHKQLHTLLAEDFVSPDR